ncbi:MAG: ABC transporter substrate-binding protein [Bacteroidia bacterium]|nr:ABC transporter substrate-binding protein [Bacteroidia bacterium]
MKRFIRPLLFLFAVSAILLLSDLQNRKGASRNIEKTRIAIFRFNSNKLQVGTETGLLENIRASEAFQNGRVEIRRYCAEGELATANTIALNILNEKFDMVVTISTPGLQVMANANKHGEVLHVFCAVTDPVASGVGITGPAASQHPAHLVGIGTFQPVEDIFKIARRMKPDLKKVGVVWCTNETCSEACVKKARVICGQLGIELVEMSVETISQVYEAALAVCSKGVEALWIGGDNVVETAMELLVGAASKSRIPVFTNDPNHASEGAMANLGANYFKVGQTAGDMVISLINGLPTNQIEIKNIVPEKLFINDSVRRLMKENWVIPEDLLAQTDSIIR